MGRAHSTATSTGDGLDHHRITDLLCDLCRFFVALDHAVAARSYWHAGIAGTGASHVFVAHSLDHVRRRPNEFDFATLGHFGEMRVLGQKSVAGMDRIDVAD